MITFSLTNNDTLTSLNWAASTATGSNAQISSVVPITVANGSASSVIVPVTAVVTFSTTNAYALGPIIVNLQAAYTDSVGPQTFTLPAITVTKVDTTKPVITLVGSNPQYVLLGQTYTELGATALDNYDGVLTVTNIVSSTVNTLVEGTYSVTYNRMDSSTNAANTVTRTVIVAKPFCPISSNSTNLDLNVGISNKGQGEDDELLTLDNIEIEVEFNNNRASSNGAFDINDLTF